MIISRPVAIIAAENVPDVKKVRDNFCEARTYPPPKTILAAAISFHCNDV
jgi:hypothetical protein